MRVVVVVILAFAASCRSNNLSPEDLADASPPDAAPPMLDLPVAEAVPGGYDRSDWRHWIDEDGDCQDARQEVLIAESEVDVTFDTANQCKVATGRWNCPYTGDVVTDPEELDVDHMVPLNAAHSSGGYAWDAGKREDFANDLSVEFHLIAVTASANRSKGARGPDQWLPTNESYVCEYVQNWIDIKLQWELTFTESEKTALEYEVYKCGLQ